MIAITTSSSTSVNALRRNMATSPLHGVSNEKKEDDGARNIRRIRTAFQLDCFALLRFSQFRNPPRNGGPCQSVGQTAVDSPVQQPGKVLGRAIPLRAARLSTTELKSDF